MKHSNDTIGNQTRDFPACSAVSEPTAPPRAPFQTAMLFCKSARALDRKVCTCTYWKQFLHGGW
jgi:hypothetical protein